MNHIKTKQLNEASILFKKAFAAHNAGSLVDAISIYRKALRIDPDDMETLYLLGTAYGQLADLDNAVLYLERALTIAPDHPEALNNLGLILKRCGKPDDAIRLYQRALDIQPDYADAHSNLGSAFEQVGKIDQAETHLRRALLLRPDFTDALYTLGLVLKKKNSYEEASESFLQVLALQPDYAEAYCDLGVIYKAWGRLNEAHASFEQATMLRPDYVEALHNLGAVLQEMGRFAEAGDAYRRALAIEPNNLITNWNLAFFYLAQGILDKGWEAHEFRFNPQLAITLNRFPFPEWDGLSLDNKCILIYAEQGLGDEIMFASCISDVIKRAHHCVIECEPRLAPLFRRSFPAATVVGARRDRIDWLLDCPKIDVQVAAGSLPRFLRRSLDEFPEEPGYLVADAGRVDHWRARMASIDPGMTVGICWRSSLRKGERHKFYSTLTQWEPVFRIPGIHFVNLQYDECSDELQEAEEKYGIKITQFPEIDLRNDLDESAALTRAVDLVITAGTAVAEIAGAVGVETWRIGGSTSPWPSLGTDRMPWHPAMTLFHQPPQGDWSIPLAEVGQALQRKIRGIQDAVEYVRLHSGEEVAVERCLDNLHTYVLKEQGGWFDPEYKFAVRLAAGGSQIIDAGAGVGEYALPISNAISGGKVLAIPRSIEQMKLLRRSRERNHVEPTLFLTLAGEQLSLDLECDRHTLDRLDFIRIGSGSNVLALFQSGMHLIQSQSPLIMFPVTLRDEKSADACQWFETQGYTCYRYVPGLDFLVPHAADAMLDAYALNLFACKPDRAVFLEKQGRLVRDLLACDLPGADDTCWQTLLQPLPYAQGWFEAWVAAPQRPKAWDIYWLALHLYAMARNAKRSPAQRYASMLMAVNVMERLIQGHATIPRLLSFCRMLEEIGRREAAVNLLNQICALLAQHTPSVLEEPVLALHHAFELRASAGNVSGWIIAMVLEQRERLRAFSSFFTGQEGLQALQEIQSLGYGSEDSMRRLALIRSRFPAA